MIERTPDDLLVTTLAMACSFTPSDCQALLESPDTGLRAKLLIGLIEMALLSDNGDAPSRH